MTTGRQDPPEVEDTAALVDELVERIVAHRPVEATALGHHDRDRELPDLAPEALDAWERELSGLHRRAVELAGRLEDAPGAGAREARGDLRLLLDSLDLRMFWLQRRPRLEQDPLGVIEIASGGLHELLRRSDVDDATERAMVDAALARARRLPRLFEQAAALLVGAPEPHRRVAQQRLAGLLAVVQGELPRRATAHGTPGTEVADAVEVAVEGIEAFGALLAGLSEAPEPAWRLGPDDHRVALRAALGTDLEPDTIERRAVRWLEEVRGELAELAAGVWPDLVAGEPVPADPDLRVRRVLAAVADRCAVTADELLPAARRAVEAATAWTRGQGLVDVPRDDLLTVTEVPRYLQGVAVAFIQPAPALEPETGSTFYLSPVPDHWDRDQARSYLREYHTAQLAGLALHEAVPGHFVQLEHASRHPRLARRLLGSAAFAEGWAVDMERLAVARGYGDDLYRLTQRKLELRIAANALLDVRLHSGDLDDTGALRLLEESTFQERAEATGKLVRAKVTAGQLSSYFVGGAELGDLRREVAAERGAAYDEREFHQQLLSHGTPTVAVAREAVLAEHPAIRRPFGT